MATRVIHGPRPRFRLPLAPGRYAVTVEGRYTHRPGLTAAGVTRMRFNSDQPRKQRAELLGLRTAFLHWWLWAWHDAGGSWAAGIRAVQGYPFRRLQRQLRGRPPVKRAFPRRRC